MRLAILPQQRLAILRITTWVSPEPLDRIIVRLGSCNNRRCFAVVSYSPPSSFLTLISLAKTTCPLTISLNLLSINCNHAWGMFLLFNDLDVVCTKTLFLLLGIRVWTELHFFSFRKRLEYSRRKMCIPDPLWGFVFPILVLWFRRMVCFSFVSSVLFIHRLKKSMIFLNSRNKFLS